MFTILVVSPLVLPLGGSSFFLQRDRILWIAEVCGAANRLEDAEAEASDEDLILIFTQGLPSNYNNFVILLDATALSNLTLNYVITRLLNEESCQAVSPSTPIPVVKTKDSAFAVTSGTRHDLHNITCFLCGLKGHYQSHCARNTQSPALTPFVNAIISDGTLSETFAF